MCAYDYAAMRAPAAEKSVAATPHTQGKPGLAAALLKQQQQFHSVGGCKLYGRMRLA